MTIKKKTHLNISSEERGSGWECLLSSSRIVIKGSLYCFEADRLFESEANYQIKESSENPVTQLINPHLLTETVVGPSQHVS